VQHSVSVTLQEAGRSEIMLSAMLWQKQLPRRGEDEKARDLIFSFCFKESQAEEAFLQSTLMCLLSKARGRVGFTTGAAKSNVQSCHM
jgi:hypothetical protein